MRTIFRDGLIRKGLLLMTLGARALAVKVSIKCPRTPHPSMRSGRTHMAYAADGNITRTCSHQRMLDTHVGLLILMELDCPIGRATVEH